MVLSHSTGVFGDWHAVLSPVCIYYLHLHVMSCMAFLLELVACSMHPALILRRALTSINRQSQP